MADRLVPPDGPSDGTLTEDDPADTEGRDDSQMGEVHVDEGGAQVDAEPAYLAGARDVRLKLADAKTAKEVEVIDREWANVLRGQVEDADEALMRSVERDIARRRGELRGEG